jgi:hypothetical protein
MTVAELRHLLRGVPDNAEIEIRGFGGEWDLGRAFDDGVYFVIIVDEEQ